ncbi:MAG: 16S rRNA (cytosine(1402)-N(4))-methyltransferase, partial [Rikenellaceae bacterium]|nr:16S rRNA (cytosine(1402)-N(4))-methyltransferase [Rikenellaceae bacterium]
METYHVPVMLQESLDLLEINPDGVYVDLTFGGGGHSSYIVQRLSPKGHLYSFDQDADAEANAFADERFTFVRSNFRFMRGNLRMRGVEQVDGVFADLGVSSHHFDATERG